MSILLQINTIFQEVFDDPELVVSPETTPFDIPDWDSVAQVKLVLALEEVFSIRLTSDEVAHVHSVGQFIDLLNAQKGVSA